MLNFWILGNNARNLHYIKKRNPRKAIRLADNKLQTKKFLGERGIPFAQTYAVIKSRKQLAEFDFSTIPHKDFVLKPNHGSKGKGICILKSLGKGQSPKKKSGFSFFSFLTKKEQDNSDSSIMENLFQMQGELISEADLKRRTIDILDGKFSLTMTDEAIIEEKLVPGEGFKEFCQFGLADLRIITFNLVPVAAMIRIPTAQSGGKANLNAGGIGCGIDIGTGKISSIFYKNKIYTNKFPTEFMHYQGKQIPFWNDILFYSSKVQYFVNLGYLALDRVVTKNGPKLLEINARAGLEVQKIANIRLKSVLQKVIDLKVQDPEKGVAIAKTLFSKEETLALKESKILYLSQIGKLKLFDGEQEETHTLLVEVDLQYKKNQISPDIAQRIKKFWAKQLHLELPDNEILLKNLKYEIGSGEGKLILGQRSASKFLLKPLRKESIQVNILNPKKIIAMETAELHMIDEKLEKFSKRYNLTARLRPINYFAELDRFISAKGEYNPIFDYKFPNLNLQEKRNTELKKFREHLESSYLKSPVLQLFKDKAEELSHKASLLQAYTQQDFTTIEKENIALFGAFNPEALKRSKEKILQSTGDIHKKENILTFTQLREQVEKYLTEKGVFGVEIVESSTNFSRMSVRMGKTVSINIAKNLQISEQELQALLAHEVDIHLVRYLNGAKSGRNIFKSWTAYYLKDEEGLAVRNAMQVLPEGEENLSIYRKYYLLAESKKYSFAEMRELLYFFNPNRTFEGLFKSILRVKKGLIYTATRGGSYSWLKDKVYLDGYEKINNLNPDQKVLDTLKKAKIKIEDQNFIL